MIKAFLTALALSCAAVSPVHAQSAPGTPAVGEILPGWLRADGSRQAAVKITLAPGWKTYWRSPGDAGIPPQFNWKRSRNLGGVAITWPTPEVFHQNGMRTIGYQDQLILPITIAPRRAGKPVTLRVAMDIGVCKDICVPFDLAVEAVLDDTNTSPTPAIAAALAARPYDAAEAGLRSATCGLRPIEDGFEIEARLSLPAMGGKEVVVIEPGLPGVWMSETDTRRRGRELVATGDMVPSGNGALVLDRSKIVITVIGGSQAVEIRGCAPA